jgi:hypothetical protein
MTEPQFPVPPPVMTAAKSVAATLTTLGTFVAVFLSCTSDGAVSTADTGTLVSSAVGTVTAILAVWSTRNKVKKT